MKSIFACADEMTRVWQSLRASWDETRQSWKDEDRDQFEREHMQEISDATNSYIASLQRLAETVQQIQNKVP